MTWFMVPMMLIYLGLELVFYRCGEFHHMMEIKKMTASLEIIFADDKVYQQDTLTSFFKG